VLQRRRSGARGASGSGSLDVELGEAGSNRRQQTLFPDTEELIRATQILVKEVRGFAVHE